MKKYLKLGITAVLVIALIVGCYYQMTHRKTKAAEDDVEVTQLEQVLSRQLDTSYPPTPREVIKFYNRIIECAYGGEYDTEQFDRLAAQARKLMDEELLAENPLDLYKTRFLEELAVYKEESRKILQTSVCATDEVQFTEIEGKKGAYVAAAYFMKEKQGEFTRTYQTYLLRQDKDKRWKILTYHISAAPQEN